MIPRFGEYGFCIGTGYTRGKFGRNSWRAKLDEDVGGIESLKRWVIPRNGGYGPGIGTGHTGGKLGRKNA